MNTKIIIVLVALIACTVSTPLIWSEIQALQADNCYAPEDPYADQTISTNSNRRRSLDEYEDMDDFYGYDCDTSCQDDIADFEDDLDNLTASFQPCDDFYDYLALDTTDVNDLDAAQVQKFANCQYEKFNLCQLWPAWDVFMCHSQEIEFYLSESGNFSGIALSDIESCEADCNVDCDQDCQDVISDIWDNTLDSCVEAEEIQTEDENLGYSSGGDYTKYAAEVKGWCVYDQLYETDLNDVEIDWDALYEHYDWETDAFDFSAIVISSSESAYLTVECEGYCYMGEISGGEFYDNTDAYAELLGDDWYDQYEGDGDDDILFDDEDWAFDCEGEECFDEDGYFIGELENGSGTNPCDQGFCYAELWACFDKCADINCPADTCFSEGENMEKLMKDRCKGFQDTEKKLEKGDLLTSDSFVSNIYFDQFSDCIGLLKEIEMAKDEVGQYVVDTFTCLLDCSDKGKKEAAEGPNADSSSILSVFLVTILSAVVLIC